MPDAKLAELLGGSAPQSRDRGYGDAIVVNDLAKRYPNGAEAVRGVSFRVRAGEIFGILGPNGAGKSTTMCVLGGLTQPSAGSATVAGYDVARDPQAVRRRIGFALQEVGVDELATSVEFLTLTGRLHGLSRREATRRAHLLLEIVGLDADRRARLGEYSGGMERRVDLASALIHLPEVLFLDEPTEGLDPRARAAIWELLERLNETLAMTILLTTHYMEEADRACDRIAIVDHGRIVAHGTPAELKAATRSAEPVTLEDVYLRQTGKPLEMAA